MVAQSGVSGYALSAPCMIEGHKQKAKGCWQDARAWIATEMSESSSNKLFIQHLGHRSWPGCTAASRLAFCAFALLGALSSDAFAQEATNEWVFMVNSQSDSSPAIAPDGTIYFGTFDGRLWAVNPNGTQKWMFRAGREIKSSPAVGSDGTIYFGCRDRKLYALGADGRKKWEFKTGAWVDSSAALASDGTIYFGSWDGSFYALRQDGSKLWEFKTGKPVVSSPAIGQGGTVYFGSHDARFYALSPDGQKVWEFKTGGPIVSSPALDWEGKTYVSSVDGFLYALNQDGTLHWKLNALSVREGSPVLGLNGLIFLSSSDGLWAVTPEGMQMWFRGKEDMDGAAAVTADGSVIFPFRGGQVVNYDHERNHRWIHYIYPSGGAAPAIGNTGTIYLPGMTFGLVAIRAQSPLAKTPWPKFRGNPRNTGNLIDSPR
jgi:outer membrane protein assembly factor BamB